jgi:platelet-activating factor acetylhydrolase
MEIEVPVARPRTFYTHEESGISLHLDTVLMAVYYPAALGTGHGLAPDGSKKWSRQLWLPRPRAESAKGYGKFAGIGVRGSRQSFHC